MSISPFSTLSTASTLGSTLGTSALGSTNQALFSNFTQTGIVNAAGNGYAYPPGSDMAQFMDGINNTVAQACLAPNGQDVTTWANELAQQAQQEQAAQQQQLASMGGSTGSTSSSNPLAQMMQLYEMLMSMMGGGGSASSGLGL